MNLALHGFFLQVIISVFDFHHGFGLCSAGEPGYLDFDNLPETNFSCQGKVIGGYYADVETGCQMFHVCTIGQKDEIMDIKFLCLNGTVFDQETRVCERVDEVDCSTSERFYNLNLELYGNNAVTLSLHENSEDDGEPTEGTDDHQQRTTSARPSTTSSTTTTTSRPTKPSTTPRPNSYQHPTGYPQHYQPQPPFPSVQTSQSKSLYDDKNGGYHHQYIFHNAAHNQNNQATSYQLFSNQGSLNPTTNAPQIHQVRYSSSPTPQVIHNEPSTVAPLFHAPSSTIHTLLNSNANNPVLINPLFHNNGIASTTEQFSIHSNNPRETSEYRDNEEEEEEEGEGEGEEEEEEHVREGEEEQHESDRRPLVAVQSINKGKVSKLAISPIPSESTRTQPKATQAPQLSKISNNFLPTPTTAQPTVRSFYPTPRPSAPTKPQQQSNSNHVTQHIHLPPPPPIPHLKPHQITINLPPPDIQRIVQNPSPLLPSQSRVIVTAKASVSDESGRPLNSTQFVTLPLPTIPASYDDYKEGDESFDPFYKDVPKIRNARRVHQHLGSYILDKTHSRDKRSVAKEQDNDENYEDYRDAGEGSRDPMTNIFDDDDSVDDAFFDDTKEITDIGSIKKNLQKFKAILLGERIDDSRELPVTDFPINQSERTVIRSEAKPSKIPDSDATNQTDTMHVDQEHITNEGTLHKLKNEERSKKINVNFQNEKQADKSVSVSKESGAEEHVEIKTLLNSKESDGDEYVEPKSLVDSSDTVQYKSNLNSKESDEEEYVETKSVLNSKESDAEEGVEDKAMKKGESPGGAEYKLTPNTEESDAEEHTGAKSAENSKESDAEEYVDPKSEKNIERTTENIKSTTVTEESDAEGGNEPKFSLKNKETTTEKRNDSKSSSNSKESDAEKQIGRKSTLETKESDADEYIEREEVGPDKTLTAKEHIEMKSVLSSKESDAEEYIETKSILNSRESESVAYVKSKSATEVGKIDSKVNDEGAPPSKGTESPEESKAKETLEMDSVSNAELLHANKIDKSKFHGNLNVSDSAKNVVAKSALNTENVSTERYVEPKAVSTIKNSDAEDKEIKSADVSESSKLTETVENTNDGRDESRSSVRLADPESRKNGELEPQEESNKEEDAQTKKSKTMSIAEEPPVEREEKSNSKYAETTAQKSRKNKAADEHSSTTDQPRTGAPRLRPPKLRLPSSFTSNAAKRTESAKENQRKLEGNGARPNGPRRTTRPPLSLESESEEQIDSQIFEEPESRTSKEVDTREVGALGGSKDSKNHLGKGVAGVQDKPAHRSENTKGPTKDSSVLDSENQSKDEISVGKEKSTERDISIEEDVLPSNEEEYTSDENTSNVQSDYEGSQQYSDEYSEEKSLESPNQIDSLESDKGPRRDKSLKFEKENDSSSREKSSRRQDKSKKFAKSRKESEEEEEGQEEGEDYTSQETLPDKFSGEIESVDGSAEYPDSREESFTESQELDSEDDYKGSQSREYGGSEEPLNSQEGTSSAVEKSLEEDAPISSTEAEDTKGVLKFTDELPRTDKKDDNADKANTTSDEDIVQDYVDDNYEPALYKEQNKKKSTSMQDQLKKEDQEMGDENREKSKDRDISDKSAEDAKEHSDEIEDRSEGDKSEEIIGPTSSTTTTTTTARTTTKMTVRPTSPKLFRPFMARKNYNYIPPSTTANPVVIKPTFGLYNPKPAKRIKSYNEIAPKPIIRKHPLLARKAAAVNSNTQKSDVVQKRIDEFENSSEIIFVSTEVTGSEENALEPVTSQVPESNEARRSNITSDKVSSDDASLQRSKDEMNPSVSETNVPISSTEKSPSEFQIATSTPYSLSRGATMANGPTTSNPLDDTLPNNNESTTQVTKAADSNSSTVTENIPENTSLFSKETMTLSSIATLEPSVTSMPEHDATTAPSDERPEMHETYEKPKTNKPLVESTTTKTSIRNQSPFNCLEKEMYRFYGDPRDCRLFHYCSPGFTSRQVLDFRFVCEEGTVFDEASQNCRHDTEDSKCIKRIW